MQPVHLVGEGGRLIGQEEEARSVSFMPRSSSASLLPPEQGEPDHEPRPERSAPPRTKLVAYTR